MADVRSIEDHAREAYPEECCGFLLGTLGEPKAVRATRRAANVAPEDRPRRYAIDPRELLAADREASRAGQEILGFYHSHPDHPARPSDFDLGHAAWPGYSYVILSIVDRNPNDLRAWLMDSERRSVQAETLSIIGE